MAVADLIYSIAGDSSKFIRALQAADKQLEKSIKGMSAMGKVGAYVTAGLGAAGTALGELSRQALNDMVEIQRAVARTGVSAEELSKLGYAASLAGLRLDDVADATFEIALKLGEAGQNEKAAVDAFAALGVAIKDSAGNLRSASDVTDDFFDAITKVPDAATRAALAAGVLGDDVALKMSPMLAQGTEQLRKTKEEAQRLGLVLSDEAVSGANQFRENLTRLQGVADGIGRQLVEVFTPALTGMTNAMVDNATATDNMRSKQEAAVGVMKVMLVTARSLRFAFELVAHWAAALVAGAINEFDLAVAGMKHFVDMAKSSLDPRQWNAEGEAVRKKIRQTFADALAIRNAQQDYLTGQRDKLIADWRRDVDGILDASTEKAKESGDKLGEALITPWDNFLEKRKRFNAENKALGIKFDSLESREEARQAGRRTGKAYADGVKQSLTDATQAGAAMGQAVLAGALRVVQERRDAVADAMADAMAKVAAAREKAKQEMEALQAEGQAITQAAMTGAQSVTAEYERLNALRQVGAISAETMATAMRNLAGDDILTDVQKTQEELDKLNKLLELGAITAAEYDVALNKLFAKKPAQLTEAQNFGVDAAKALQSSFADFLFDPFGQGLEGMVKGFASAMARIVAELLAKKAVLSLLGAFGASPEFLKAVGGKGFAEGGYVAGPGTSTSDSIPARLSNGEYVMPANAVRHFGVDFMDAIRAMQPARQAPVARFAEGGYVNQQASSGGGVRVVNVVDSSMVQDFLTSSAGEQVILNTIRRNRRQVSQVVG